MIFPSEKIESFVAECRFSEAAALCEGVRPECASIYALAGDERALASIVEPELVACRTAADVASFYARRGRELVSGDHLIAAVVLTWSADASGAYDALRRAYDAALLEGLRHRAVGARERLAHHALLFGDVEIARSAIDDALALAQRTGLTVWGRRCLAAAARLALDAGDRDRTESLLAQARSAAKSPEELALFAATGAQFAVELGDDAAMRQWTTDEVLDVALRSAECETAVAATLAGLIASGAPSPGTPIAVALRRALLTADGAANRPELFALAARYGDLDEARLGADALAAVFAPNRAYLKAHHLLARAHVLLRSGERAGWVDSAGDAARAFNAMGLRRWTNDAMLLLVTPEPVTGRRQRGRPTSSALTGREQQVAQLIRRGARNREVAIALQISEHTVERHVSSILGRLGLRSRWQIVDPRRQGEH
ncbi:MAG TPA: helix-turn-helix transcriptional regulator [Candidatus Binatia bacterium]|nr:helix-turn-helix transcriptional regulator [Candidatus Binatia bacterium]